MSWLPVASFTVPGLPKAQPRPRMTRTGHVFTSPSADMWKASIAMCGASLSGMMIDKPVSLSVDMTFPPPKHGHKHRLQLLHTSRPDVDNLLKAIMDAMTGMQIWLDDSFVSKVEATKRYGDQPGAVISISVWEAEAA